MKYLRALLVSAALALSFGGPLHAAESSGSYAVVIPGDLAFGAGGLDGQFLIFSDWSATPTAAYTANTIIKHSSAIWIALTAPGAADEPGVAAVWKKITDQTGAGGGASITAGTADPTGGSDGDAYIQADGSDEIQAIWRNASGTWNEYTIPAGGTGAGDITAVTTGGNSGLSGGATSGAADLEFDPDNLPTHVNVDSGDLIPFGDVSATGTPPTNITYRNLAADLADVGIGAGTDGLHLEVSEIPAVTSLQGGDEIPFADDSQTNDDTRKVTVTNLAGHLADGTTITADSDGVLTATSGGAGDITAVNTPNNSGLSGGDVSGDVDLALDINNLPAVTSVTTGDHFLIADFTDSNAQKKITADHFGTHLAGTGLDSTTTGQLQLDLDTPILASTVQDTDYVVIADASDTFATKRVSQSRRSTPISARARAGAPATRSKPPTFLLLTRRTSMTWWTTSGSSIREHPGDDRAERHMDRIGRWR